MITVTKVNGFDNFMQFLYVMIIFIAVLALTYFVTKWIGKLQGNKYSKGNIELLEACRLTNSQYIQLVKIGKRVYAISVSKDTTTLIGEIPEDELVLLDKSEEPKVGFGFAEILEKVRKGKQEK